MADQKKAPPRKGAARKNVAKARTPEASPAGTASTLEAAQARKTRTRRAKATAPVGEATAVGSLFDAQLPQELRAAIDAAESFTPVAETLILPALPDAVAAPAAQLLDAGAVQARQTLAQTRATGENLRQAMAETAQASTLGALEVNGKVIEALRAQSDVAFDLWRAALTTSSLSDAISLQTSGARQAYETASSHWADVAESARRWFGATVKPLQAAWTQQSR